MIRKTIEAAILSALSKRMARQANAVELMSKFNLHKHVCVEPCEKEEIDRIWKPLSPKIDYRYWMVYKGMFQFSPLLMPDDIYVSKILRVLNPMRKCYCMQNKNMYPILYRDMRMPETLINYIDGQAYGSDNISIDRTHIIKVLKQKSRKNKVILKPSADSCSGNGVVILDLRDETGCIDQIINAGNNFVIQEILSQSEKTKRFCPTSLNTFRVNTLNLNGRITVENIMFRHGRGNSIVDNAGAGGICIGFNPDGTVVGKAIDAKLNVYETTVFGESYRDLYIPELKHISDTAMEAHLKYLPMMGHAAWDFALNENDDPVFIEVNLGWPGIMTEQLSSCRPIFGNRTSEVIEYSRANQNKISFTDFIGHWT